MAVELASMLSTRSDRKSMLRAHQVLTEVTPMGKWANGLIKDPNPTPPNANEEGTSLSRHAVEKGKKKKESKRRKSHKKKRERKMENKVTAVA
uniref:Uncharacterized protein n=1 Tax=Octactis speculum TaxID=3111310 RepID=A0A7S2DSA0_9STRA